MASSSFYSGTGVTPENTDVTPVAPSNITAVEDSKNAAALSEAAAAASATASATSASSGAASASTATTKASESAASATASSNSAAASQASRVASESAKVAAETAKTAAETARDAASASEVASGASEVAASTSETNAAASAAAALSSENAAATSAATASTKAAESATSATASEASNVAAGVAQVAAETAETNAETAQAASEAARDAAAASETAAATSEANASTSASTATTQAGISTTKAGEASTSATAAEASKVAAAASQVAASNSQVAAASSASSAAAIFDQFDDTYLGSKSTEPTVDNDGNALATGALFYNSATGGMFIWDGTEWIAASAAGGASLTNFAFTSTAGQTSFSGSDDNSNTLVYTQDNLILILNGVILEAGTDYTATDGTTIVLTNATVVNDELNVIAFKTFTTADMVSSSNGGTFYGNVDFSAGIDVTGNITVTGTVDGRDVAADGAIIDSLGTAATTASTAYATAAQGALAASATQPGDLATVATSGAYSDLSGTPSPFDPSTLATVATTGAYSDLSGTPTLGTAASTASSAYATAAQGALADSATQPGDLATVATSGAYGDLSGTPTLGTAASSAATDFVGVTGDSMTGNLSFGDNDKAIFGAGSDLEIFHNGSASVIKDAGVGDLYLAGSGSVKITNDAINEDMAVFNHNGSVDLYYDSAKKLATTSTGIDVTGNATFADNGRAIFGASSDLQIRHSSSDNNSYIEETGSGSLVIAADQLYVQNAIRSETKAVFTTDGGVSLRYNDAEKFATTAGGITVNSTLDLESYGSDAIIRNDSGPVFMQSNSSVKFTDIGNNETFAVFNDNGAVDLYYDNIARLSTSSTGITVTGTINGGDLRGEAWLIGRDNNDYINVGTTQMEFVLDGNTDMLLQNDGDLHVDGNVIAYSTTVSDERLKTDIVKIDSALDKVDQINGYTFTYTADGKKSAGVIAQEVEKVLPSAITESTLPLKMGEDDKTEYKTVQYDQLIGLLVEAVKELKAEVAELKGA